MPKDLNDATKQQTIIAVTESPVIMYLTPAFRCLVGQSVELRVQNNTDDIDPRANHPRHYKFDIVNRGDGRVTVTRLPDDLSLYDGAKERDHENGDVCTLRAYTQDDVSCYDFKSTWYLYYGLEGERAPLETTELFIHPLVEEIRRSVFCNCRRIRICNMRNSVHTIRDSAFALCCSLTFIRLSRGLRVIEELAFDGCTSLEALFLPPSIESIGEQAFVFCERIRIFPFHRNVDVGELALLGCWKFFRITEIQQYDDEKEDDFNSPQVQQSVLDFYENLLPLHRICLGLDGFVTFRAIQDFIDTHGVAAAFTTDHDGMTPLHIIAMNPHADSEAVFACFSANKGAVFVVDHSGKTPLNYMIKYDKGVLRSLILSYYAHVYSCFVLQAIQLAPISTGTHTPGKSDENEDCPP